MALPSTKKLIDRAKAGEKLSVKDRRQAVAYLNAAEPHRSNTELAELFKVSERMIRFDRKAIQQEIAKEFAGLDPTVIVGDLLIMRDRQIANIEKSLLHCEKQGRLGTRTYLEHCLALQRLMSETTKTLQDLGVLPKELGTYQIEKYEYKAFVIKDGQVVTRRVDMFDEKQKQISETSQSDIKQREILDAEFIDVPALPSATETVNAVSETSTPIPQVEQVARTSDSSGSKESGHNQDS